MKNYYLKATLQKSYYRKAQVFEDDSFLVLRSYDTDVLAIDKVKNKLVRLWNGWSATTAKHINDFLLQNGFGKLSKKEWLALPCVNDEPVYNVYLSTGFFTHKSPALLTVAECENTIENLSEKRPNLMVWYE